MRHGHDVVTNQIIFDADCAGDISCGGKGTDVSALADVVLARADVKNAADTGEEISKGRREVSSPPVAALVIYNVEGALNNLDERGRCKHPW